VVDLTVLGLWLDSMFLKVFSNLNDSVILWFKTEMTKRQMIPSVISEFELVLSTNSTEPLF